jgi:hypothetical protein
MPRLISVRSRRKLGRLAAPTRLDALGALGACAALPLVGFEDLSRIMAGIVGNQTSRRNGEPGAIPIIQLKTG